MFLHSAWAFANLPAVADVIWRSECPAREAGFTLVAVTEPVPSAEAVVADPGLALVRRRPPFYLIAADRLMA